jgi:excisionase family DNA binding protein
MKRRQAFADSSVLAGMTNDIMAHLNNRGPRLLSSRETATILNCHLETLYRWVKEGVVQHTRVGAG